LKLRSLNLKKCKPRCIVCDETEHWENVDSFRFKSEGMAICNNCGFISYPTRIIDKSKLSTYYKKDYRQPPSSANVYSGQRKLQFHGAFLESVFNEWKTAKIKSPVVVDVGTAFGMYLDWFRGVWPKGKFYGTEWDLSNKRIAKHRFNIDLDSELNTEIKYDLITSYKVSEHQIDADLELMKYRDCLKDGGYLYISVPVWHCAMVNPGLAGFDLEFYYHPDHINSWSRKLFLSVLKKTGWEIVKENRDMYDETFLCRKVEPQKLTKEDFEEPEAIKQIMKDVQAAAVFMKEGHYKKAIEKYPNFPNAHLAVIEYHRKEHHKRGYKWILENILKPAIKSCPHSVEVVVIAGDISLRYNKFKNALDYFNLSLHMKPNNPGCLINLAHTFRRLGETSETEEDKIKFFKESRRTMLFLKDRSLAHLEECTNWIFRDDANIPIKGEENYVS